MLKIIIYISVGYLIYRVAKNGAHLILTSLKSKKGLNDSSELIKCVHCNGFVSANIAIAHHDLVFCSEECVQSFKNKQDD